MEISRSQRFFLNLDTDRATSVNDLCLHWQNLLKEDLTSGDWGEILQPLVAVNACMDEIDQNFFASAIKDRTKGFPVYRKAYKALSNASNPSHILAGMQFFARHNSGADASFFEESHLKLRRYLSYMPAKDLASTLYPFVKGRYLPHDVFWDEFQEAWCEKFNTADILDIQHVYERAARLALPMNKNMLVLFDGYLRDNASSLVPPTRDRFLWVAAMIDSVHGGTILTDTVPKLVKEYGMTDTIRKNTVCIRFAIPMSLLKIKGNNYASMSELDLKDLFANVATLRPEKDHTLPHIASPVDMRYNYKGYDIIIEMDGLTHFNFDFSGERRYNGQTILNSSNKATIAKSSRLLHIDDRSYSYLFHRCSNAQQDRIASEVFETAISKNTGNHIVILRENGIIFDAMQNNSFILI